MGLQVLYPFVEAGKAEDLKAEYALCIYLKTHWQANIFESASSLSMDSTETRRTLGQIARRRHSGSRTSSPKTSQTFGL